MPIPFRAASFAWRNPAECKSKVTTSRSCPTARSFLPGAALQELRPGTRRSNFCLSLAALGPLCGCVTLICLLRALMGTIGNGRLACRSSRPWPKGAIQAGFASAVRDDRGVRSRRGGIMRPASLLRSAQQDRRRHHRELGRDPSSVVLQYSTRQSDRCEVRGGEPSVRRLGPAFSGALPVGSAPAPDELGFVGVLGPEEPSSPSASEAC